MEAIPHLPLLLLLRSSDSHDALQSLSQSSSLTTNLNSLLSLLSQIILNTYTVTPTNLFHPLFHPKIEIIRKR